MGRTRRLLVAETSGSALISPDGRRMYRLLPQEGHLGVLGENDPPLIALSSHEDGAVGVDSSGAIINFSKDGLPVAHVETFITPVAATFGRNECIVILDEAGLPTLFANTDWKR